MFTPKQYRLIKKVELITITICTAITIFISIF